MKTTYSNIAVVTVTFFLIGFGSFISAICSAAEVENYKSQLTSIDKAHQAFNKTLYNQLIKTPELKSARHSTIENLIKSVTSEQKNTNPTKAIALIIRNESLLTRYYDSPETMTLLSMLLDNNALSSAEKIINNIQQQGDDAINGQLSYLLASFYFQRKDWENVLTLLTDETNDLPLAQYNHALLIRGIALQNTEKHNLAIKAYKKIVPGAHEYSAAQLNIAIANIRQGWWTDAHDIISTLLTELKKSQKEQALNRLYITLGYSLLNQSYYRNARKTFQLVGLDSRYSNQALLGIALTAAHQDDYIGALNAARFLKEKQEDDLPIDEAFLLMPFFYEKSQQLATASLGYSQAANYYQDKITKLNKLIKAPLNLDLYPIEQSSDVTMNINKSHIRFSDHYPNYFFTQRQNLITQSTLIKWPQVANNKQLTQNLSMIKQQYNALTVKMTKSIMTKRVAQLNSYLNQSRYGLARLYDNNTVEQ